ncbi:rhomboid family intramembrane serine protease [Aeoliella mucimassa]|uniref:Intramembrane serine protease GlpG n=1 Tax=Aeoliella mucimassa TaxID=2527972 RepID=A0A518AL58_9BACT|nr:rhomboid family intramembrane serine protease [Aeoliella mucimassa]QDU55460.1 intramembrane serine protease GlpG [Aeoliella mucimassa]
MLPLYDENPHRRFPIITILLIVINVWITFQTARQTPVRQALVAFQHGFVPARLTHIGDAQPLRIRQPMEVAAGPWGQQAPQQVMLKIDLPNDSASVFGSLLTSMFLHGSWLHLLSNMWMLWIFGNNIEDRLGYVAYSGFYVAGGLVAAISQWAIDPESQLPMIGASGAVAAVLGGYALTFPWAKVKTLVFIGIPLILSLPAFVVLGTWMLMETVLGIMQIQLGAPTSVAHWAHIGGFVAGLVLMPILAVGRPPEGQDWNQETEALFQFDDPQPLSKRT